MCKDLPSGSQDICTTPEKPRKTFDWNEWDRKECKLGRAVLGGLTCTIITIYTGGFGALIPCGFAVTMLREHCDAEFPPDLYYEPPPPGYFPSPSYYCDTPHPGCLRGW